MDSHAGPSGSSNYYPPVMELTPFESHWREVFQNMDTDGDGKICVDDLTREMNRHAGEIPDYLVDRIIAAADRNRDGYISYHEFCRLIEHPVGKKIATNYFQRYVRMMVPKGQRFRADSIDGSYEQEYKCSPPALTMIVFSLIETVFYAYDYITAGYTIGPKALFFSLFVYNPHRRLELWRFVTYMFVHSSFTHLFFNLTIQIMLGIPLEMVHRWWRITAIYLSGVVSGSMCTSVTDPSVYLAGASGGVYAILAAHIATIVLNWGEMDHPALQLSIFLLIGVSDVANALYMRYVAKVDTKIGYSAHFAGALAGFLVGIYVLRNLKVHIWERIMWWVCFYTFVILMILAVLWNLFYENYFEYSIPFGQDIFPS